MTIRAGEAALQVHIVRHDLVQRIVLAYAAAEAAARERPPRPEE